MKEHATNEKAIHIILYLADNPKSTGKTIADKTDLSESDVSKHLNNLKKENILDNQTCSTQEGKNYSGKCWFVIPDFRVLEELVDRLDHDRLDHDRTAQTAFMRSQYYRAMVPDMVDRFIESIPDDDLWKFDTHQHTATREQPLTDDDKDRLTTALIPSWVVKPNWLALKFVAHFISVNSEERSAIIHQLTETTCNRHTSPTAANAAGYRKGICLGMDRCQQWIRDGAALQYIDERLKAELNNDYTRINWEEFFHQLDHLNANYSYLFD